MMSPNDAAASVAAPLLSTGDIVAAGDKELLEQFSNMATPQKGDVVGEATVGLAGMSSSAAEATIDDIGHFYTKVVDAETARLKKLVAQAEEEIAGEQITENVEGIIRAAVGKANLLMDKKFLQFRSLCDQNMITGATGTDMVTNDDLRGFWELVMLQVDHINQLFTEIDEMRKRAWMPADEKPILCHPSANKKHVVSTPGKGMKIEGTPSKTPSAIAIKADEKRKLFMETRRRLMKQKEQQEPLPDGENSGEDQKDSPAEINIGTPDALIF